MPSAIKAIFGADSTDFVKEMQRMEAISAKTGKAVERSFSSTVLNPNAAKNASADYVAWWNKAFSQTAAAHEKQMAYIAKKTGIMGATGYGRAPGFDKLLSSESNAGRLAEEKRLADVEAASRNNKLSALRRIRAEERASAAERLAEEKRLADVEAATRANRASELRRQRVEDRDLALKSRIDSLRETAMFGVGGVGGGFGGINSGWTQIIHSLRATFDSMASGMSPARVMAQQLPQIAQGFFLMGKRIPGINLLIKDQTLAARSLANAWAEKAAKDAQAALAEMKKAQAAEAAIGFEVEDTAATRASATADMQKAQSALAAAEATKAKAVASGEAAAMAEAEAGAMRMAIGPLGVVVGLAIAAGAAYAIWRKHVEAIAKSLSGPNLPGATPRDISRLSAQEEGMKKITDAVQDAAYAYNSVSAAADRAAKSMEEQHDTERKLLELKKQRELNKTDDPKKKFEIESRYRREAILLERKQMFDRQQAMEKERQNLVADAAYKKRLADEIKVSTSGDAQDIENDLKARAEAAREHLQGKMGEYGVRTGGVEDEIQWMKDIRSHSGKRLLNTPKYYWKYGMNPGSDTLKSLEDQAENDRRVMAAYDDFQRNKKPNESLREYRDRLYSKSAEDAAKATTLGSQIPDQVKKDEERLRNMQALAAAEDAVGPGKSKQGEKGFGLNSQQRIGAYAAVPPDWSILLQNVASIARNTNHLNPGRREVGATKPQWGGATHR